MLFLGVSRSAALGLKKQRVIVNRSGRDVRRPFCRGVPWGDRVRSVPALLSFRGHVLKLH